jgi:hypothetical protein
MVLPAKRAAHGLKRWSAAVEVRRGLPDDVEIGDANQGHRRLAPVLAKLPSSFTATDGRWRGGSKARRR